VTDQATREQRFLAHAEETPDRERAHAEFERIIDGNVPTGINYLEKGRVAG